MSFSSYNIQPYIDAVSEKNKTLNSTYKNCSWNDSVHNSFQGYISICNSSVKGLEDCSSDYKRICNSLDSLNIDMIIKKTKLEAAHALELCAKATEALGGV